MSVAKGYDVVAWAITLSRNHNATYRLRACGVDPAAMNNAIAESMRRHLGVVQSRVAEREHSRSRREKMTSEPTFD